MSQYRLWGPTNLLFNPYPGLCLVGKEDRTWSLPPTLMTKSRTHGVLQSSSLSLSLHTFIVTSPPPNWVLFHAVSIRILWLWSVPCVCLLQIQICRSVSNGNSYEDIQQHQHASPDTSLLIKLRINYVMKTPLTSGVIQFLCAKCNEVSHSRHIYTSYKTSRYILRKKAKRKREREAAGQTGRAKKQANKNQFFMQSFRHEQ